MKPITIDQISLVLNNVTVFILTLTLLWIAVNVVRYFAAANYHDKDTSGSSILHGCITLYVTLAVWGILMLVKNNYF